MSKVLISGGTGLVGRQLTKRLLEKNFEIAILSRTKNVSKKVSSYFWDPDKNMIDAEAISTADYIIHLAGVNIGGKRWTSERRRQIYDSRIKSAKLILDQVKKHDRKPKAFITSSAIGYYGAVTTKEVMDETHAPSDDFLGQTCREWEQIEDNFTDIGVRSVKIRTGIVLSKNGGALPKLSLPVRLGIGSPIGNGNQYLPWIHIDDLCNIYIHTIENSQMAGPYNAVAPEHYTNKEFIKAIARKVRKSLWLPNIPASVVKLLLGEMSVMLLYGSRVSSEKIVSSGYKFVYPDLDSALEEVYN